MQLFLTLQTGISLYYIREARNNVEMAKHSFFQTTEYFKPAKFGRLWNCYFSS